MPNQTSRGHPLATDREMDDVLRRASVDDRLLAEVADGLRDRPLLLPLRGAVAPEQPPVRIDARQPGSWPALIGDRDHPLLPAFTSAARLRDWGPGARFLAVPLDTTLRLASLLEVDGVVVDPGTDHAVALLPADAGEGDQARATGRPPPFFASQHPLRALAIPMAREDLAAIERALAEDRELATIDGIWAVELQTPEHAVRLVLAVTGTWTDDGAAVVPALASRLHGNLGAPGYLDVDVVALSDEALRAEVAAMDDPIHPRGT